MPETRLENGHGDARRRYVTALLAASLSLATVALVFFLGVPVYSGQRSEWKNPSPGSVGGPRVLIPLVIPIVIAAAPLLARKHGVRIAAAALLLIFCIIGAASVGLFYLPAALALIAAACISDTGQ
jgi:hypothetical protein